MMEAIGRGKNQAMKSAKRIVQEGVNTVSPRLQNLKNLKEMYDKKKKAATKTVPTATSNNRNEPKVDTPPHTTQFFDKQTDTPSPPTKGDETDQSPGSNVSNTTDNTEDLIAKADDMTGASELDKKVETEQIVIGGNQNGSQRAVVKLAGVTDASQGSQPAGMKLAGDDDVSKSILPTVQDPSNVTTSGNESGTPSVDDPRLVTNESLTDSNPKTDTTVLVPQASVTGSNILNSNDDAKTIFLIEDDTTTSAPPTKRAVSVLASARDVASSIHEGITPIVTEAQRRT